MGVVLYPKVWTAKPPTPTSLVGPHDIYAWWLFNEGGGAVARDAIGRQHGTISGTFAWRSGLRGQALWFNGASVDPPAVGSPARYSIEALVKPEGGAGAIRVIVRWQGSGGIWALYRWSNDLVTFYNDTPPHTLQGTAAFSAGVATHVVGVFDGSTKWLYVNGQLKASAAYGTTPAGTASIRTGNDNWNQVWVGDIYYVRIWSRPLRADEVQALYVNPYHVLRPSA
jgi:hypothetical protein